MQSREKKGGTGHRRRSGHEKLRGEGERDTSERATAESRGPGQRDLPAALSAWEREREGREECKTYELLVMHSSDRGRSLCLGTVRDEAKATRAASARLSHDNAIENLTAV